GPSVPPADEIATPAEASSLTRWLAARTWPGSVERSTSVWRTTKRFCGTPLDHWLAAPSPTLSAVRATWVASSPWLAMKSRTTAMPRASCAVAEARSLSAATTWRGHTARSARTSRSLTPFTVTKRSAALPCANPHPAKAPPSAIPTPSTTIPQKRQSGLFIFVLGCVLAGDTHLRGDWVHAGPRYRAAAE